MAGIAGVALLLVGAFALGLFLTRAHDTEAPLSTSPRDTTPRVIDEVRHQLVDAYYRTVPTALLAADSIDELIEACATRTRTTSPRASTRP